MQTTLMTVTPALAAEWLQKNEHNRTLSRKRVLQMADKMRRGLWRTTHQGVAFDSKGYLADGQHRLAAIVESGITQEMLVSTDVDAFEVIDTGKVRSAADVLSIVGHHNVRTLSTALRFVAAYDGSALRRQEFDAIRNDLTPIEIERLAERHADALAEYKQECTNLYKKFGAGPGAYMAAHFIAARWCGNHDIDPAQSDEWFDGLYTGVDLQRGDPRLAFASWMLGAGRAVSQSQKSSVVMMLLLRGFEASLTGERLARLLVRDVRTFIYHLPGDGRQIKPAPLVMVKATDEDDPALALQEAKA